MDQVAVPPLGAGPWVIDTAEQHKREVREGPDGFLYLLTDEDDGPLLRIEPATA